MFELSQIFYAGAFGLIVLGMAGIVLSSHLIRIIFAIAILEAGVNLLLLMSSFRETARAPIMVDGVFPPIMADPITQALVLTAIVIGVGISALALSLALRLQGVYGTMDMSKIRRAMERDIAHAADISLPTSDHAPLSVSTPGAIPQIEQGGAKS